MGRVIIFTLAGMVLGYLLMHPFAMLAYILGPYHFHEPWDFSLWVRQLYSAFSVEMLVMGWAFAFMGGVAGFGLEAWYLQKERLAQEQLESQRRQPAASPLRMRSACSWIPLPKRSPSPSAMPRYLSM